MPHRDQLPMAYPAGRSDGKPVEVLAAVGAFPGDVTLLYLRPEQENPDWWNRKYPSCAPHRIVTLREIVE